MKTLLESRLSLNYQDLLVPTLPLDQLRLLQGSSREMHDLLSLPAMLKEIIERAEKEEKQARERENDQPTTES